MTRLAIFASILIACGDDGAVPDELCGNGEMDPGEECDDGNTARGDGCFECVLTPPVCGNGILDIPSENCDDSNTDDGDGCSATCQLETPPRRIMATWIFKNLQGNVTTGCPAGFDSVKLEATSLAAGAEVFTTTMPCAGGTGTSDLIPPGQYSVVLTVLNAGTQATYATSLAQEVDVAFADAPFTTTIFNDAGYFTFGWQLQGAISMMPLACANVLVQSVRVQITVGPTTATDTFDCDDASGISSPLLAGTTYSLTFQALDSGQAVVGTSTTSVNKTITAPNDVTPFGTAVITIPNQ
jgi:cysteine-rich repeat protein